MRELSESVAINSNEEERKENEEFFSGPRRLLWKQFKVSADRKITLVEKLGNLLKKLELAENENYVPNRVKISNENKKYKTFEKFVNDNADDIDEKTSLKIDIGQIFSWIIIKIIGPIFMTLYFIGILEIIGLLNKVGEEIKSSFNLIILEKKRETDFYQNYIDENLEMPSFDLFFLSSLLTSSLTGLFTFPGTVAIISVLLFFILIFGLDNFDFHTGDSLNERYSIRENIYLIGIYLLIYIFIGIIALIPHDKIDLGFTLYDKDKLNKKTPRKNGFIFVYLFSMVVSSIIKMVLDRKYVFDEVKLIIDNKKSNSFFNYNVVIIIIYSASMISSFLFYAIYACVFEDFYEIKSDSIKAMKIFGYIIYIESEGCCINCADCGAGMEKCSYCFGLNFFQCCCCCYCCCSGLDEASNGQKKLCIIYKIRGICSSICDLLAGWGMIIIVLIMYLLELITIGFNPLLSDYLESGINEKEIFISNVISFSSIIGLYFINLIIGIILIKCCQFGKELKQSYKDGLNIDIKNSEFTYISSSIIIFLIIPIYLNTIISAFFHYKVLDNVIFYFIAFSTTINEYANIILVHAKETESKNNPIDLINKSFAISFYKLIFKLIKFLLGLFNFGNEGLVFFQFILGCILSGILSIIIIYLFIC